MLWPRMCGTESWRGKFMEQILPSIGAFLIGLSKAGFATGLSMLTTPLVATAMPARLAIGLILPLLIFSDFLTLGVFWKKWNLALLRWPLPGCVLGVALGMLFVNTMPDNWLRRSLGALALVLTMLLIIRNVWYPSKTYAPLWWQGILVGALAGFSSTLAHAAGPVMALFLMAQKVDKQVFVATNAVFFTLNNLFKLPPYVISGLITVETLKADVRFIPFIPLGVAVGWGLNRVVPQKAFVYLVYGLLIVTSLHLLRG